MVTRAIAAAPKQQAITATASLDRGRRDGRRDRAGGRRGLGRRVGRRGQDQGHHAARTPAKSMLGDRVVRKLERRRGQWQDRQASPSHLRATWKAGGAVAFAQRPDRRKSHRRRELLPRFGTAPGQRWFNDRYTPLQGLLLHSAPCVVRGRPVVGVLPLCGGCFLA